MANFDKRDWKCAEFDGLTPSIIDWARIAAYLDGEGSILINPRKGRKEYATLASSFYLKLTVANTDPRLLIWLKNTLGGTVKDSNSAKYYVGKNWKQCWNWSVCSNRAAWILFNCLPYLLIKSEQAEIGIQLQESMNTAHRGCALPGSVVEERRDLKAQLLKLKARGINLEPDQRKRLAEVQQVEEN